jgi:hypothetical protein
MSLTRRDFFILTSAAASMSAVARSAFAQVGRAASNTTSSSATPMQRADALLAKMTIEEKAMQLSSVFP